MQEDILDIENVMTEIKKRAKERDYEEIPEFEDSHYDPVADTGFDLEAMQDDIRIMQTGYEITTETPVSTEGLKGFVKKSIRNMNRFWAAPMAAQQTGFNSSAIRVSRQLENYILMQQDVIESLKQRIEVLEKGFPEQRAEVREKESDCREPGQDA